MSAAQLAERRHVPRETLASLVSAAVDSIRKCWRCGGFELPGERFREDRMRADKQKVFVCPGCEQMGSKRFED